LPEHVALAQQAALRGVDARALVHRHHGLEHREARSVRRRHRDTAARERERRLDQSLPREPSVRLPDRSEPRGDARHRARRGADRVVHELRAERHVEMHELGLSRRGGQTGHGAEAVEVPRAACCGVVIDRVTAAEQAGHHRLGNA